MDKIDIFPEASISGEGVVSAEFISRGIDRFTDACNYVHRMPYGYNSDRDDLLILFKEGFGTCTTKHAVIATLAKELQLPVVKNIGVYAMTEAIVTGTSEILREYDLPYLPMVHCFLVYEDYRVDLTEGNRNGKNDAIDEFLFTARVIPNITAKDEYLLYRQALKNHILVRPELQGVDIKRILQARERGLERLKANVGVTG
jgi:hypothetical protein